MFYDNLSDWVGGLTLEERVVIANFSSEQETQNSNDKFCWLYNEWKSIKPFAENSHLFESRLESLNVNKQQFNRILKNEVSLKLSEAPLDWALHIERLYNGSNQADLITEKINDYPSLQKLELLKFVLPIIADKIKDLEDTLYNKQKKYVHIFDLHHTIDAFLEKLISQLAKVVSRTLVLEMHVAKHRGLLQSETPKQRYQDYIRLLSDPKFAYQLLTEYPVLARKLIIITENWASAFIEFVNRLVVDYPALCENFSSNISLGKFQSIGSESGDSHKSGRSVIIVNFTSGNKVVYKPRSISIEQHFQELLTWFNKKSNKLNFKTLKIIERESHGWVEFVSYKKCNSHIQLQQFYFQLGALQAVLYSLKATDFHYENFIAFGNQPVAIDLETLFQTKITGHLNSTDSFNVLDIGMLPTSLSDENTLDVSGMGANKKDVVETDAWTKLQTDELILGKGKHSAKEMLSNPSGDTCASNFINEITNGFVAIYQLINDASTDFVGENGLLNRFIGDVSRLVFKDTQTYADLLWESYHPTFLRCGLQTNKLLDHLWGVARHEKLISSEVSDIINNDIPYFESEIDSNHIKSADGHQLQLILSESSLESVKEHIKGFSDKKLSAQCWLISTSLKQKTNNNIDDTQESNPFLGESLNALTPQYDYLALAEKVGDFLGDIAIQNSQQAVWVGQYYQDESCFLARLDASLYKGQLGIVWFLAYLAKITKKEKYKRLAEKSIQHCLDNLLKNQLVQPSIGGFDGLGSFIYVLSHLQYLWPEKDFSEPIKQIINVLPEKVKYDEQLDIVNGTAGCLIALQSAYQVFPSQLILDCCKFLGDKLINTMTETSNGKAWKIASQTAPLAGFSHGVSGISLALTKLSNLLNDDTYFLASRSAVAYENSLFSFEYNNWLDVRKRTDGKTNNQVGWAWCHGAPGIAIERVESANKAYGNYQLDSTNDLKSIVKSTLSSHWPSHYALCHGSFGNIDILSYIAQKTNDQTLNKKCLKGLSLTIKRWTSPYQTFEDFLKEVPSLGLMVGTAGIGYTLLRHASPEDVPCILALQEPL
jgi:type 2 lantibiotic biosynthesis protein LanM